MRTRLANLSLAIDAVINPIGMVMTERADHLFSPLVGLIKKYQTVI
jgi:hypothetical protein